jgi:erythromycin esterase-like protein
MRGQFAAVAALVISCALGWSASAAPTALSPSEERVMDQVVRDVCSRRIVFLGEAAEHGDAATLRFKAALVPRLVQHCRFNAMFFESNHYDFLALDDARRRHVVTPEMVSAAVGAIWNRAEEFQSLPPFLAAQANAGRLVLGGLYDEPSTFGALYSTGRMPVDLTANLEPRRRAECLAIINRQVMQEYTRADPSTSATLKSLLDCLDEVDGSLPSGDSLHAQMVANLRRNFSRGDLDLTDLGREHAWERERSKSMNLDFEWLASRLPPRSKIIVWTATVHAANSKQPFEGDNVGTLIHRKYGDRAFSLGFTALAGSHGEIAGGRGRKVEYAAPASSLEQRAFASAPFDAGAVYLGKRDLAAADLMPSFTFGHRTTTRGHWGTALDGLVVFRRSDALTLLPLGAAAK